MAATSFADYMARVSASMIHAALANAAEKAAAAAHQQQQQSRANGATAVGAGTACASPSLVPFFPLPLLTFPPVAGQIQMPNGTTTTKANVPEEGKTEEQREKQRNLEGLPTQGTNGKTTPAKANRIGNGGGKAATTALNSGDNGRTEEKPKQNDAEKQRQPNKPQNDGPKKRKRSNPSPQSAEETPKQQLQQQQQQLIVKAEHQSSESPLSASRISSPDSVPRGNGRGARKLKLYVAEEKVDIIDYAKCIGNRAAGREFNVAESSIREWRKNEEKIRRQAESTLGCTQHFEQTQADILAWVDDQLVKAMAAEKGEQSTTTDWYAIAAKARQLWAEKAESSDQLDGSEMKITMGWVSRFMRRNEQRVPKIAPPVIATGNGPSANSAAVSCCSASGNSGGSATRRGGSAGTAGLSMVKSNPLSVDTKQEETSTRTTRPKRTSRAAAAATTTMSEVRPQKRAKTTAASNGPTDKTNGTEPPQGTKDGTFDKGHDKGPASPGPRNAAEAVDGPQHQTNAVPTASSRRRKCLKPMRVDATCATLLTTSGPTDTDHRSIGGMP